MSRGQRGIAELARSHVIFFFYVKRLNIAWQSSAVLALESLRAKNLSFLQIRGFHISIFPFFLEIK